MTQARPLRALPTPSPSAQVDLAEIVRALRRVIREEELFTRPDAIGYPAVADALGEWGILADLLEGRATDDDVEILLDADFTDPTRRRLFEYLVENARAGRLPDVETVEAELVERWDCDPALVHGLLRHLAERLPANLATKPAARAARLADLALLRRELAAAGQVDARARTLAYMSPERLDPAALRAELRDAIRGAKR